MADDQKWMSPGSNWQDDLLDSMPTDDHRKYLKFLLGKPDEVVSLTAFYKGRGKDFALKYWMVERDLVDAGLAWWPPFDIDTERPAIRLNWPACQARGRQVGAAMKTALTPKEGS